MKRKHVDIQNLRRNYDDNSLNRDTLNADPIEQFRGWFEDAQSASSIDWFEPNAMTLATSDSSGRVSARIVLLKHFSPAGFTFFTNYQSHKAQQLADNPNACLVFYWPHVERQVRIQGQVSKTDASTSDEYFHARPWDSQLGAIASPQSRPLEERRHLEEETERLAQQYEGQTLPRPDYWGGYVLTHQRLEFWQGRPSRLHDRFIYELESETQWKITRLAP